MSYTMATPYLAILPQLLLNAFRHSSAFSDLIRQNKCSAFPISWPGFTDSAVRLALESFADQVAGPTA